MIKRRLLADMLWLAVLLAITALLLIPLTHLAFIQLTESYPYGMGFIKFALLATMGELLVLRLTQRTWKKPVGLVAKIIVWGLIGVLITFMFRFYAAGVAGVLAQANISAADGIYAALLAAFLTSLIMNLTFGVVFMGLHRLSDTYIDLRASGVKPTLQIVIETIRWDAFISFVVFKTIPLFWIPAHTITFLLPPTYRVIVAAYLSIVLGAILVYASTRKHQPA